MCDPFSGVYPFASLRAGSDKGGAQGRPFDIPAVRPELVEGDGWLAQDRPFDIPAVRPELVEGDGWLAQDRLGAKSFMGPFDLM